MRKDIKEKLDKIDELFPKERIEKSKKRWEAVWTNKFIPDRMPYVYECFMFNSYDDSTTGFERLNKSLDEIILRGQTDEDFIPSLFCGCRQSTIPNMFGAKEIIVGNDITCTKLVDTFSDIDKLPAPSIYEGSTAKMFLDMQKYFLEETDGRLMIHVVDMQGPFDAAAQIMGYDNLFVGAYEDEERFDKVINLFTDAFTLFWTEQQKLCGKNFIPTHLFAWNYVPDIGNASMSVDSLAMVSPQFYEEYYIKILNRLTKTFKSITVHSCGDFSHVVPSLMKTQSIKGVNASQMSLTELYKAGLKNKVVSIVTSGIDGLDKLVETSNTFNSRFDVSINGVFTKAFGYPVTKLENWSTTQLSALKDLDKLVQQKLAGLDMRF